jgi:hypothetical protein
MLGCLPNTFWEWVGWLAFALNVWGNLALTSMGVRGWIIRLASNACWIGYSVETQAWALLVNHGLFAGINVYGWWKWSRRAKTTPQEDR